MEATESYDPKKRRETWRRRLDGSMKGPREALRLRNRANWQVGGEEAHLLLRSEAVAPSRAGRGGAGTDHLGWDSFFAPKNSCREKKQGKFPSVLACAGPVELIAVTTLD
jgi:hypothetical protein